MVLKKSRYYYISSKILLDFNQSEDLYFTVFDESTRYLSSWPYSYHLTLNQSVSPKEFLTMLRVPFDPEVTSIAMVRKVWLKNG